MAASLSCGDGRKESEVRSDGCRLFLFHLVMKKHIYGGDFLRKKKALKGGAVPEKKRRLEPRKTRDSSLYSIVTSKRKGFKGSASSGKGNPSKKGTGGGGSKVRKLTQTAATKEY